MCFFLCFLYLTFSFIWWLIQFSFCLSAHTCWTTLGCPLILNSCNFIYDTLAQIGKLCNTFCFKTTYKMIHVSEVVKTAIRRSITSSFILFTHFFSLERTVFLEVLFSYIINKIINISAA
jgi:hypothetical protein